MRMCLCKLSINSFLYLFKYLLNLPPPYLTLIPPSIYLFLHPSIPPSVHSSSHSPCPYPDQPRSDIYHDANAPTSNDKGGAYTVPRARCGWICLHYVATHRGGVTRFMIKKNGRKFLSSVCDMVMRRRGWRGGGVRERK